MRRSRRRHHGPYRHGRQHPALVFALVFLIMGGMGGVVTIASFLAVLGIVFMPLAIVLGGVGMMMLLSRPRHRPLPAQMPTQPGAFMAPARPMPVRPAPPRPDLVWANARSRFHALRDAYAAFECDTMEVLRLPALADVSVASTARFVDAFAEAQALETDTFPPVAHAERFGRAVDLAERTWQAACDAAERIRLTGLSAEERRAVERVVKLLTTARDSDSEPERLAAYALARAELIKLDAAGAVHVPRTARAALDDRARGQLPA
jgi:hypothetical protein